MTRQRYIFGLLATIVTAGALIQATPVHPAFADPKLSSPTDLSPTKMTLPSGAKVSFDATGNGTLTSADGKKTTPFRVPPVSGQSAFGPLGQPSKTEVNRRVSAQSRPQTVSDQIIVGLSSAAATGAQLSNTKHRFRVSSARAAKTSSSTVNTALQAVKADAMWPVAAPAEQADQPTGAYVVHVAGTDVQAAATKLAATAGVEFAEPNRYVDTTDDPAGALPKWAATSTAKSATDQPATLSAGPAKATTKTSAEASAGAVPTNATLASSQQAFLNSSGVNAIGAFADTSRLLHQLPGTGVRVTNVSLGDLTDQSMADAGDSYVAANGATTIIKNGQRYLDYPSLPLIPTYTTDAAGTIDPTGSVENEDPALGEILLDFSVMSPLPHDQQRPDALGSGENDLLGIAPGAQYRLVVPQQTDTASLAAAFVAAAHQTPKPDVITASIGWGTDSVGFPGRYLEDDTLMRSVIAKIVKSGIPVVIASNDGTRLSLPVSVGPDGGSTPTNVVKTGQSITDLSEDALTTTPTQVPDSGAIAVGASTLDDDLTSATSPTNAYPTTRYNGFAAFSSGFGSRVNISAPGDNLPVLMHACPNGCQSAQESVIELSGGTSASAPMVAATLADVIQAARATGKSFSPAQLRNILVSSGRPLTQTPQADQTLNMGPQLNVTAAVEQVLGTKYNLPTQAVRMSVAERQEVGALGGYFSEATDPDQIDLNGPDDSLGVPTGENAASPITFGIDLTGAQRPGLHYRLLVNDHTVIPADGPNVRLTPTQLLAAIGQPLASTKSRTLKITYQVYQGANTVLTSASRSITLSATDGTYLEALAPDLPGSVALGRSVAVKYDLTGVRNVSNPYLYLSSVGHWTPNGGGDFFRAAYKVSLPKLKGTVTIPASAFASGGGGLYGVGIATQVVEDSGVLYPTFGEFRAIRVGAAADERPVAPVLGSGADAAHMMEVNRSTADLPVSWDVRNVKGATGAAIEFSAPGPTLFSSLDTVTNQNGSQRDHDGVDNPSVLFTALPSTHGTTKLDLVKLGVPSSLQYSVRVFATKAGRPTGQASGTSYLQYDDGELLPAGQIQNFDLSGSTARISTVNFDSNNLVSSSVQDYDTKTGKLGQTYPNPEPDKAMTYAVGTDTSLHRTLVADVPFGSDETPSLIMYDTATGKQWSKTSIPAVNGEIIFESARVDPDRHRAAIVTYDPVLGFAQLWGLNLKTGALLAPLTLNDAAIDHRAFYGIDIDRSTGAVFVATTGTVGLCSSGRNYAMVRVDLDAGTVSPSSPLAPCTAGLATDGKGGSVTVLTGPVSPNAYSGDFSYGSWQPYSQKTLLPTTAAPTVGQSYGPAWPVIDAQHGLLLFAHLFGTGVTKGDNNAMSEIDVVDMATGKLIEQKEIANLVSTTVADENFEFTGLRGLQLDPSTRTAWLVGPDIEQLQRVNY